MNSAKVVAIMFVAALLIVACNQPGTVTTNNQTASSSSPATFPASTPDLFAEARQNFEKYCVACHGEKANGGRVEVEGKRLKVPSLREGHALEHSDERLAKQISEGDDEMPAFKDKLTPAQISDLVRFIRKEFQGK